MAGFATVGVGQFLSLFGSTLTGFAVGVWMYQVTGSTALFSLLWLAAAGPAVVAAPFAGVWIDRLGSGAALAIAHAGAGACSLALLVCFATGVADPSLVICLVATASVANALVFPALATAVAAVVPADRLVRANGAVSVGMAIVQIGAAPAAAALLGVVDITGILAVDVATFAIGLSSLLALRLPPRSPQRAQPRAFGRELASGWRAVRRVTGLPWLLAYGAFLNIAMGSVEVLLTPFVLNVADEAALSLVYAVAGIGLLLGGLVVVSLDRPARRVRGMFLCAIVQGGALFVAVLWPMPETIAAAGAVIMFGWGLSDACNQFVWQRWIPGDCLGRAFGLRAAVNGGAVSLAYLLAGPLVDSAFAPLARSLAGGNTPFASWLRGQPAPAVALMTIGVGVGVIVAGAAGLGKRSLRRLDAPLPSRFA